MFNFIPSMIAKRYTVIRQVAAVSFVSLMLFFGLQVLPANAASIQPILAVGVQHQVEGAMEQGAGKAQETMSNVKGKAEGLARQVQGRAKSDIGRVESATEGLAKDTQKTASNIGEQVQEAAGGIAESVKSFIDNNTNN